MKGINFTLICLILLSLISCTKEKSIFFPSNETVNQLMAEAMKNCDLPTVVAIAVNRKGEKVIYTYGKAIWTEDINVTAEHIFRIASMTKPLTSIAALQLVEDDLIELDQDLSELLPEMSEIPILSNGELITPKHPITLRHLLTHTSGFGYSFSDEELMNFSSNINEWNYEDFPRRFESGTNFLYGTSTDWVGRLVEKISKISLEEYFKNNITGPLGMTRTFFNVPDSLHYLIVSGGARGEDGNQELAESFNRTPSFKTSFNGGGGLYSTPNDYTKLLYCLLNNGYHMNGQLLKSETIHQIFQNQIGDIEMDIEGKYIWNPGLVIDFKGLIKPSSKWGLIGCIDNETKQYGREAGTVLWGGVYNTYFFIDPYSGVAASIWTQHLPFNHRQTTKIFERFSEIIYSMK